MALNDRAAVLRQYQTSEKLDIRIAIHSKYSVNRQSFAAWIAEQYRFPENARILEIGCGTGSMWKEGAKALSAGARVTLTDFSEGMLEKARENLGGDQRFSFFQADAQALPYADGAFDAVIAHMMLYHVPDIPRALGEIRRVLKSGGAFYCATYGERGVAEYVARLLNRPAPGNTNFTLQNGQAKLSPFFESVRRADYEDALAVTNVEDMLDYIASLNGMAEFAAENRQALREKLLARMENGVLRVPKEYGMFICR